MSSGSLPSGEPRWFLKRRTLDVVTVSQPEVQVTAPRAPSPQPQPPSGPSPPQPIPTQERLLPPPAQSHQPALSPHPASSAGRPTFTAPLSPASGLQSPDADSGLSQGAKGTGGGCWIGLKATLQLLERNSDAFPRLKSAVAGFLGVVDIFEVGFLVSHDPGSYLFRSKCRQPHGTGKITQSSLQTFKV